MTIYEMPAQPEIGTKLVDSEGLIWAHDRDGTWRGSNGGSYGSWTTLLAHRAPLRAVERPTWQDIARQWFGAEWEHIYNERDVDQLAHIQRKAEGVLSLFPTELFSVPKGGIVRHRPAPI